MKTTYALVNSVLLAEVKLQVTCIVFVNMAATLKLIIEKKNLTAKQIRDIMKEWYQHGISIPTAWYQ